jgi:hypothetical protein
MDELLRLSGISLILQTFLGPAHDSVENRGFLGVGLARPEPRPHCELVPLLELTFEPVQTDLPADRGEVVSVDCAEESSALMDEDACGLHALHEAHVD